MHEWSLAESVACTAVRVAEERNLKTVTQIMISLGQLQQIEEDIFMFAMKAVIESQKKLFENTDIQILPVKAVFKCKVCGMEWCFADKKASLDFEVSESIHFVPEVVHAHTQCPGCKSPDFEIVAGRGVWIDSISGEEAD